MRNTDPRLGEGINRLGAAARSGATGGVTFAGVTLRTTFVLRNQLMNILAAYVTLCRFLAGIDSVLGKPLVVPLFPPPAEASPENDREMTDAEVDQLLSTVSLNAY